MRTLMRHLPGGTPGAVDLGATSPRGSSRRPPGADTVDVAIALRLALMLENVECRPKETRAASAALVDREARAELHRRRDLNWSALSGCPL